MIYCPLGNELVKNWWIKILPYLHRIHKKYLHVLDVSYIKFFLWGIIEVAVVFYFSLFAL